MSASRQTKSGLLRKWREAFIIMPSRKEIYTKEKENCVQNILFFRNEIARMKEKLQELEDCLKHEN